MLFTEPHEQLMSPVVRHVGSPCAWICPAADVHAHVVASCVGNGFGNGLVALFFVEVELLAVVVVNASAEIDLDEVEAALLEEEVAVLLVVLVESHAFAQLVASVIVAAGVVAGVRVDARLHAQQVDVLHHGQQSVGESGRVDEQFARLLVAPSEVAVVDVDVVVSHFQKTLRLHGSGLILND